MTITIDRAGRVVIPKSIRDRLHLGTGAELEVAVSGEEITLRAPSAETKLMEKRGVLVFGGDSDSEIDIADFINEERNHRASTAAE